MNTFSATAYMRGIPLNSLLVAFALAACGGDSATSTGASIQLIGRLERGSTVQVVLRDAAGAPVSSLSGVAITPAAAGQVSGNTILLTQAGPATVSASGGGKSASLAITIPPPPTIFFDAVDQANRDIYSAALDGQDRRRWTTHAADDEEPTVAAGQIVFSSARSGGLDLYGITMSSGVERRITTSGASETEPALSPDGNRLAYSTDASGGLSRIWIATIDNAGAVALTPSSFGFGANIEVNAKWSPTGDRLVFAATPSGRANLFISASTAGATPTAVPGSTTQNTDVEPAWSPDGNRIVFASTRAGGTLLFIADLRTGTITKLNSDDTSGQPVWLADGRIVFTRYSGNQTFLSWLDPDDLASGTRTIPLPYVRPQHPAPVR